MDMVDISWLIYPANDKVSNLKHLNCPDFVHQQSNSMHKLINLQMRCKQKIQLGVSKNSGIPKWMVYNGKPY